MLSYGLANNQFSFISLAWILEHGLELLHHMGAKTFQRYNSQHEMPNASLWLIMCVFSFAAQAPAPPRRAPAAALSTRSKSMTSELEDLGKQKWLNYTYRNVKSFLLNRRQFSLNFHFN